MHEGPRLLLATDLSARCDRALDRAVLLSRQLQGEMVAAHVIEQSSTPKKGTSDETLKAAILADFPEIAGEGQLVLARGSVPATIAALATELGCAMIVTGVARFNNLGDFFLGTAVDHLVRHATVPVLVVKKRARRNYQRVLLATDFSASSRYALERAAELFPEARISLVHAYHVPYEAWLKSVGVKEEIAAEAKEEMTTFLSGCDLSAFRGELATGLAYGDACGAIDRYVEEDAADLLVLGTHGRSGMAHAALGSCAASLLATSACDVMMVRTPRR